MKYISSCPRLTPTPTPTIVRTGTRSPKEVKGAKVLAVEATVIAKMVVETTQLQINMYLKGKIKTV